MFADAGHDKVEQKRREEKFGLCYDESLNYQSFAQVMLTEKFLLKPNESSPREITLLINDEHGGSPDEVFKTVKRKQKVHTNFKIKSIKTVAGKSVMISLEDKEKAEKMQQFIAEEIPKYKNQPGKRFNPRIRIHRLFEDPLDPRTKANVDEFIEKNFADRAECERAEVKLVKQFDMSNIGYYDVIIEFPPSLNQYLENPLVVPTQCILIFPFLLGLIQFESSAA